MITANQFFKINWETYRQMVIMPAMAKQGISQANYDEVSPALEAYVNHGRWIVKCECKGAEKAWEEGWFMCRSCLNAGYKHQYRQSVFPKERIGIEKLLTERPLLNRNWYPGETLSQLKAENREHTSELLEVN